MSQPVSHMRVLFRNPKSQINGKFAVAIIPVLSAMYRPYWAPTLGQLNDVRTELMALEKIDILQVSRKYVVADTAQDNVENNKDRNSKALNAWWKSAPAKGLCTVIPEGCRKNKVSPQPWKSGHPGPCSGWGQLILIGVFQQGVLLALPTLQALNEWEQSWRYSYCNYK